MILVVIPDPDPESRKERFMEKRQGLIEQG